MNNKLQQMTYIMKNYTPQQVLQQFVKTNPMIGNLIKLNENNPKAIEEFVKNYCKEQGINFEQEFNEFIESAKKNNWF